MRSFIKSTASHRKVISLEFKRAIIVDITHGMRYVHTYVGTRRQSCAVLYLMHDAQEVHMQGNDLLNVNGDLVR